MAGMNAFQWRFNGKILAFVLVFLPLTLVLGFWQLDRAAEKEQILAAQQEREQMPALDNTALAGSADLHLRRFALRVVFDPERWFLLDNRVQQGRPGYEVLNLAQLVDGESRVMVNRGWTPAALDRRDLPDLPIPEGEHLIQGYFYAPDERPYQLGEQGWSGQWPERIQYADLQVIGERLADGEHLVPAQLRLAPEDPLALVTAWQVVNQTPDRHIGYAVQWFAMALALLVLAVFANSNMGQIMTRREKN